MSTLVFKPGVAPSQLSGYAANVLRDNLDASHNPEGLVDSLARSPWGQATAMYNNLEKHGVANQRALYTSHDGMPLPGCQVIDMYELGKQEDADPEEIERVMAEKIVELGPEHVSAHCRDPKITQVVDLSRARLPNPLDFIAACRRDPRISKVLDESYNACVHVEIPQASS